MKKACEERCYIKIETCGTECNVNGSGKGKEKPKNKGKGKLKYCSKCIQDCSGDDTCMNGCVTDKKCTECSKCFEYNMQSVDLTNVDLPAVCTSSCSKQKTDEMKKSCEERCYIKIETCGTECNVNGSGKGKGKGKGSGVSTCGKCIDDCSEDDTCMNQCVTDKKCTD